jgi:hypothetical protein
LHRKCRSMIVWDRPATKKMVLIVDSLRICGNLRILHIGTRSSKFTVSTWGQLWPTRPQLGPNLDPTRAMLCLGTSPAQVELHVGSTWRTWPTQYEVVKNAFSLALSVFVWHRRSCALLKGPVLPSSHEGPRFAQRHRGVIDGPILSPVRRL